MLNIAFYFRNENQNYNEVPPHTNKNGHNQKSTNNVGEKGTSGMSDVIYYT